MAVSAAHITSWDGATSGSWTPNANRLILIAIGVFSSGGAGTAVLPTSVSGNGITYAKIAECNEFTGGGFFKRLGLWRGMSASPSAGAVTLSGGSTEFIGSAIAECDGVDTGGSNGSAAVVQSAVNQTNSATSLTATLAAFGSASNATFATGYIMGFASAAYTQGSGFTKLFDGFATDRPMTEFRVDPDTSADFSWTGTDAAGIVAIEIKAAGAAAPVFIPSVPGMMPRTRPRAIAYH